MKRIAGRTDARGLLLSGMILLIPFLSWGRVPWLTGVFGLLVAMVMLMWIRGRLRRGGISIPFTELWIPFAVIFCLSALHIPFSPVPYSSLLFTVHLSLAGIFYILLLESPPPNPGDVVLIWVFILVAWIAAQVFAGSPAVPSGPFLNPNYLATVLLTCLGWTLGSLIPGKLPGRRTALLLAAALASTAGLAIIGSRSAGLGILGLWGLYLLTGKGRLKFAAVIVIALVFLLPTTLKHRVTDQQKRDPHAFSRILIWKASLEMGLDHPFLGVGPNLYYENAPRYAFPTQSLPVKYGRIARKPHNEYLRSWAEGGILGVSGVILFLLMTSRLMLGAWHRGSAGPVLAVGVILFQALFHDLNEVFALTALGAWWLAQISADSVEKAEISSRRGRAFVICSGVVILLFSLWLNLDVSSRVWWIKGQQLMNTDGAAASRVLARAHAVNPLLPGVARDLAQTRLAEYRNTRSSRDLNLASKSIRTARRLNLLDTVPLRLEADLHLAQAGNEPEKARDHLQAASRLLVESLAFEPFNAQIMLRLSLVYRDLGQYSRALTIVDGALEKEPNYLDAHRARIFFLEKLDPVKVEDAREEFARARDRVKGYYSRSVVEGRIIR